jgi:hypothetical protein
MKLKRQRRSPLAKGQVWRTGVAHIEIMSLNDSFIHYKVIKRLGLRHISSQISGIDAMEGYLKANKARLIQGSSEN